MSTLPQNASLSQMVLAGSLVTEIASFLDGLDHAGRLAQVDGSPRSMQPKLFALARSSPPLSLETFVPASIPAGRPVVHHGWNSLPLPSFGRRFKKPMVRHAAHPDRLFGYNDSPFTPIIGPGYFLHTGTAHEPSWAERGATVIDYHQIPDHEVPAGWPRVVPNSRGLQFFVYNKTRDFMRRVSRHLTIGAAFRGDKMLGAYFMLLREDL